jgi:uncharacterized protein YqjF (DUF2071 family)
VEPSVMQAQLPSRFTPKLHDGHAIAGICLIRLEAIRPRFVPPLLGVSSENAAHRIAVRWHTDGRDREGVFIPRRDTGSVVNHLSGGRLFPGEHHLATFAVQEAGGSVDFRMKSADGQVGVSVRGSIGGSLPVTSCFSSLSEASAFFEPGSVGYSVTHDASRLDGIELRTQGWSVEALQIEDVHSTYFSDETRFPKGSVAFDCALVMRNLKHEWHSVEDLYV